MLPNRVLFTYKTKDSRTNNFNRSSCASLDPGQLLVNYVVGNLGMPSFE